MGCQAALEGSCELPAAAPAACGPVTAPACVEECPDLAPCRPARPLDASEDGVRVCDIKDGGPLVASRLQQARAPRCRDLKTVIAAS